MIARRYFFCMHELSVMSYRSEQVFLHVAKIFACLRWNNNGNCLVIKNSKKSLIIGIVGKITFNKFIRILALYIRQLLLKREDVASWARCLVRAELATSCMQWSWWWWEIYLWLTFMNFLSSYAFHSNNDGLFFESIVEKFILFCFSNFFMALFASFQTLILFL